MPVTPAEFKPIDHLAANVGTIMFTALGFATEAMAGAMSGAPAAEPSRKDILRKVGEVRAESHADSARRKQMMSVMTAEDVARLVSMPERYLPGLPSLTGKLTDDQLADYVLMSTRRDDRLKGLLQEFMAAGEEFQRRAAIGRMEVATAPVQPGPLPPKKQTRPKPKTKAKPKAAKSKARPKPTPRKKAAPRPKPKAVKKSRKPRRR